MTNFKYEIMFNYFLLAFAIITTTITTIATTIKIPTPTPALKMPAIALQELKIKAIRNKKNAVLRTEVFIRFVFV